MSCRVLPAVLCFAVGCASPDDPGAAALLDAKPRAPLACKLESRWVGHLPDAGRSQHVVLDGSGQLWTDPIIPAKYDPAADLQVSRLGRDDAVETDTLIAHANELRVRTLVARPAGGVALAWIDGVKISIALLDGTGTRVGEIASVPPQGRPYALTLALAPSGEMALLQKGFGDLSVTFLDATAQPLGTPTAAPGAGGSLVTTPAGYALASSDGKQLWLTTWSRDGTPDLAPVAFARVDTKELSWGGPSLLTLDDGFVVAWVETRHKRERFSFEPDGAYSSVLLQKLDLQGNADGPVRRLMAPVPNQVEHAPALGSAYGQIAVLWSSGPYEFDCEMAEACSHRDDTKFVLLDREDLEPRSDVLAIVRDKGFPNLQSARKELGWFDGKTIAEHDGEVVLTATVSDSNDARTAPASARVRCGE